MSAISWKAILGGAVAAAASTVVLLALGVGFGLSSISPWPNSGASAVTFSIVAGIWMIVVQWLSAAIGGYLTGRLRTKWVRLHTHEVFFRDTAHGFLTWAVASLLGAFILASAASSAIGTGTQAAATVASGAAQGAGNAARTYDVDTLFRGEKADLFGDQRSVTDGDHSDFSERHSKWGCSGSGQNLFGSANRRAHWDFGSRCPKALG